MSKVRAVGLDIAIKLEASKLNLSLVSTAELQTLILKSNLGSSIQI